MSGVDPLKVACLVVVQVFISGCGEDDPVSLVLEQATDNQVFVKGGEFVLGDIGKPDGSPYVTLTDHSRPVVKLESIVTPYLDTRRLGARWRFTTKNSIDVTCTQKNLRSKSIC